MPAAFCVHLLKWQALCRMTTSILGVLIQIFRVSNEKMKVNEIGANG
jgi:hypothetical protein